MDINKIIDIEKIIDFNLISKDDENFLKKFLKDFYHKIIETKDFNDFEKISNDWIKYYLDDNNNNNYYKDSINILKLMKNHQKSNFWFTSIIGLFYKLGIGCDQDKLKAQEFYLLAINNEIENDYSLNENFNQLNLIEKDDDDNDTFNSLKNKNIIIGKYLLSLFYYEDIILDINFKQNEFIKLLELTENDDLEAKYNLAIF
ncbi:unnamed protein product [Rhizophagus irregularis]|nr:unnamed protein product [Rhizophagus irregularis]